MPTPSATPGPNISGPNESGPDVLGPAAPTPDAPIPDAPRPAERVALALEELWVALFGWIPTPVGMFLRHLAWAPLFGSCRRARFGTGLCLIGCRNMSLGHGVRLGRLCFLTAREGELALGDGVAISPCANIGADGGRIVIGAHTAIGPGTVIRAANHRFSRRDMPIMRQGHVRGEVIIEDDVWIGANCVITPDVHIGRGAVVGAGAVVTRDVEPYTIVGGVPAHEIGRRD